MSQNAVAARGTGSWWANGKWWWIGVGAFGVAALVVAFFFLPEWMVQGCAISDQATQLAGKCLTASERLQAQSYVRTTAVQVLGALVVLAGASAGVAATLRGLRETRQLACQTQEHERQMAADERQQTRLAEAYVPLVHAVIATDNHLQSWDRHSRAQGFRWNGPPPEFTPPPGVSEEDLEEIAARLDAFGSPEVRARFDAYRSEAVAVRSNLLTWMGAQARMREAAKAGQEVAPEDREARRQDINVLVEQLSPAVRDRARAELRGDIGHLT